MDSTTFINVSPINSIMIEQRNDQSWWTCKYSTGNLDLYNPMLERLGKENNFDRNLVEHQINQDYFCRNDAMINLGAETSYFPLKDRVNKTQERVALIELFHLDVNQFSTFYPLGFEPTAILFGEDRDLLEQTIKKGLSACVHCKFYKPNDHTTSICFPNIRKSLRSFVSD